MGRKGAHHHKLQAEMPVAAEVKVTDSARKDVEEKRKKGKSAYIRQATKEKKPISRGPSMKTFGGKGMSHLRHCTQMIDDEKTGAQLPCDGVITRHINRFFIEEYHGRKRKIYTPYDACSKCEHEYANSADGKIVQDDVRQFHENVDAEYLKIYRSLHLQLVDDIPKDASSQDIADAVYTAVIDYFEKEKAKKIAADAKSDSEMDISSEAESSDTPSPVAPDSETTEKISEDAPPVASPAKRKRSPKKKIVDASSAEEPDHAEG